MSKVDFMIVGSGLFGAVFAQQCKEKGKTCLVIDKRDHIGGNVFSKKIENIEVHMYGPHIFSTNNDSVWNYVNKFSSFIQYAHKVKVNYNDKIYSMPVNLQTLYEVYGTRTPIEAIQKLNEVKLKIPNPTNLEDYCLSQVGPEIYEIFIKGYTKKQWMQDPKTLPTSIIKRLPVRTNFDDRWHQSKYSGIPSDGYTRWVKNMLEGVKVELGQDFFNMEWKKYAKQVVYSGKIDELFSYCFGELNYRTLRFDTKILDGDFQGVAQVNYTEERVPFTRTIEHKHFTFQSHDKTVVTWEYPEKYERNLTPYYPINDKINNNMYTKYKKLLNDSKEIIGGGRLCDFRYYDMDMVIASALKKSSYVL